jgi:hypothetical protein
MQARFAISRMPLTVAIELALPAWSSAQSESQMILRFHPTHTMLRCLVGLSHRVDDPLRVNGLCISSSYEGYRLIFVCPSVSNALHPLQVAVAPNPPNAELTGGSFFTLASWL